MRFLICCAALILGGCAAIVTPVLPDAGTAGPYQSVQPFSLTTIGETAPPGWEPWILSRFMARTQYRIVELEGERVLAAKANISASGLLQPLALTPSEYPIINWRWRVPS